MVVFWGGKDENQSKWEPNSEGGLYSLELSA